MNEQNYKNHARFVPAFHFVLFGLIVLALIGSGVNLYLSLDDHSRLYNAALITTLCVCLLMLFFFTRIFALKAQDRAIRAEENLRHFVLTGKLIDPRLDIRQVIALRFAPDAEFVALCRRAADETMAPSAIKQAVKNWRADHCRA
jgi:hypothetical protein